MKTDPDFLIRLRSRDGLIKEYKQSYFPGYEIHRPARSYYGLELGTLSHLCAVRDNIREYRLERELRMIVLEYEEQPMPNKTISLHLNGQEIESLKRIASELDVPIEEVMKRGIVEMADKIQATKATIVDEQGAVIQIDKAKPFDVKAIDDTETAKK